MGEYFTEDLSKPLKFVMAPRGAGKAELARRQLLQYHGESLLADAVAKQSSRFTILEMNQAHAKNILPYPVSGDAMRKAGLK